MNFRRLFILMASVLSLAACGPKAEDGYISCAAKTVNLKADGSVQYVTISSNTSWTASVEDKWASVTPASGSGTGKIDISAKENQTVSQRSTVVKVTSDAGEVSIAVNQAGVEAVLAVEKGKLDVPSTGGTVEVGIEYNVEYVVTVDESGSGWITYVETKGSRSGKLVFSIEANGGEFDRTGIVHISEKGGAHTASIEFSQKK